MKMRKYIHLHGIDMKCIPKTTHLILEEKWPTPTKFLKDVSDIDLSSLSGEAPSFMSTSTGESGVSIATGEEEWLQWQHRLATPNPNLCLGYLLLDPKPKQNVANNTNKWKALERVRDILGKRGKHLKLVLVDLTTVATEEWCSANEGLMLPRWLEIGQWDCNHQLTYWVPCWMGEEGCEDLPTNDFPPSAFDSDMVKLPVHSAVIFLKK